MTTLLNLKSTKYMPFLADGISLLFFLLVGGHLMDRYGRPDNPHSLERIIDTDLVYDIGFTFFFYLLFLVGIMTLSRMHWESKTYAILQNKKVVGGISVLFAALITILFCDLTGFFTYAFDNELGEIGSGYYKAFTPGFFLFLGLIYLFFMVTEVDSIDKSENSIFRSLLFQGIFTAVCAAYFRMVLPQWIPEIGNVVLIGSIIAILTIMFALPRIVYFVKTRNFFALISFDILLLTLSILAAYQIAL